MQIVSGDTINAPITTGTLVNTATMAAVGDSGQTGESSTATVSVTSGVGSNVTKTAVAKGQTATISFWDGIKGQALIDSFNGGSTATYLGNWLAANFPDLYGKTAGSNDLAGATNAQVATYYQSLFNQGGQQAAAQTLALALSIYATDSTLAGGTMAANYGFTVSSSDAGTGTALATYNVGNTLSNYGGPAGTVSLLPSIVFIDSQSKNGSFGNGNSAPISALSTLLNNINQVGGITG